MQPLHTCCSHFISKIQLSEKTLPRWHILANKYCFEEALNHCRRYLASGTVFDNIDTCAFASMPPATSTYTYTSTVC